MMKLIDLQWLPELDMEQWRPGLQVIYIPDHVQKETRQTGELPQADIEQGFITSWKTHQVWYHIRVWARFWSKSQPDELRTKSNSEVCSPLNLYVVSSHDQKWIDNFIKENYDNEQPNA